MNQRFKWGNKWRTNRSMHQLYMTKIFHARLYGRFKEIKSNLWRKKLNRTNQGSNFLVDSFSNWDYVRAQTGFRRERQFWDLKRWFSLKNRPSRFNIIAPVIFDWSHKTSSVSSIEIKKPYSAVVLCRSEVSFSCYHKSDVLFSFRV